MLFHRGSRLCRYLDRNFRHSGGPIFAQVHEHVCDAVLFYGLYFGVLGRDFAELCSWRMNQAMGYSKKDDDEPQRLLPRHICALCAVKLRPDVEELIEGQYFANDDVSNAEQRSLTREERVVKIEMRP